MTSAPTFAKAAKRYPWLGHILQFGRYHGVWAVGVRLLRGQSMARQALMVLAMCALPVVIVAADVAADVHQRLAADARSRAALDELAVVGRMTGDTMDFTGTTPAQQRAFQGRQRRLLDSLASVRSDDSAARLLDVLGRRWSERAPSKLDDRTADLKDLVLLHDRVMFLSGLDGDPDPSVRVLIKGPPDLLPKLAVLHTSGVTAVPEMRSSGADDVPRAARYGELQAQSQVLLAMLRESIDQVVATNLIDGTAMHAALLHIEQYDDALQDARFASIGRSPDASDKGDDASAKARLQQADAESHDSARVMIEACFRALGERLADRHRQVVDSVLRKVVMLTLGVLMAFYLMVCHFKVVSGGIRQLCQQVGELASGNLTIRPVGRGNDEISVALTALGTSAERLSATFSAVTQGVGAVSHAAREVATGNRGLAGSTGDVRSAIVSVTERASGFATLMEDCGGEVELTVSMVRAMRGDARRSRNAMSGLRERMRALNAKSREINEVVKLMESVAFQTKLLALNASVEAARAGEEGKGFAVVAQEVRALALRSEQSAQRIHGIVGASMVQIDECNRMTDEASAAVTATDERIQTVHRSMGKIVAQTQAGMTGSREVAGITRLADASIGGNARIVDQLSAASAGLRDQGDALRRSVQHFSLA